LRLYYKCRPGEQIRYVDFTSLYPAVQKQCVYPIGHPTIFTENFKDLSEYFGIVSCKILPPSNLHIPVLPAKKNGKLYFALCNKCAEDSLSECNHNDNERAFTGVWTTPEIMRAISKGYKVLEIFEVYHYEQRGDLFSSYINSALKLKQEASGFPKNVQTEEEKDEYIKRYFEVEGIQLEKEKIKKNPGMRTLAKLMLNCLWGYFAMQTHRKSHEFVRDRKRFYELLFDERYDIHQEYFEEDSNILQVIFSEKEEFHLGNDKTNVIVASFVTAYARLRLFDELDKLGERVLYFDTDSIFYIHREAEYNPSLGDYLGQFTNEIDAEDGNYITEFVSTGPKSYAYRTDKG
jgi:hypothetical protein